ncbi:MAG: sulfotransferase domain-containing protein [Rhodocyclaceae bacterium]|nr:sulfotransferase domain-containing protein [Rhodocyclaceae bacterium]
MLNLLCSYPKSGNTWLRAVLNEYFYPERAEAHKFDMDFPLLFGRAMFDDLMGVESSDLTVEALHAAKPAYCRSVAAAADLPAYWKVHDCYFAPRPELPPPFPPELIGKVVQVIRDPRDVAVSLAHYFDTSTDHAIDMMGRRSLLLGYLPGQLIDQLPQFVSSWSHNVQSWLAAPLSMLTVRYENLLSEPEATFGAVFDFLGLDAGGGRLERAVAACRFDSLQAREQKYGYKANTGRAAKFFRRGLAGAWRDELSAHQVALIERDHGELMRRLGYLA